MKRAVFAFLSAALLLGCADSKRPARLHVLPWAHEQVDPMPTTPADSVLLVTDTLPADPVYHPPILYFAFNSADLRATEIDKLYDMLAHLHGDCVVNGYASPEGAEDYNLALSAARAQAVLRYLVVSPKLRLTPRAYGVEGRVDNNDPDLYWLDRRVLVDCK